MRSLLTACWRTYRRSFFLFHAYYLMFQALALLVLIPAGEWVFGRLVAASGHAAVGNEQLVGFFLSPVGIATLVVTGTLLLALDFSQLAGFVWIASADIHGESRGPVEALRKMSRKASPLLGLGFIQLVFYLLAAIPFVAAGGAVFKLVTHQADVNFLLAERPPIFWLGAAAGALLALGGGITYLTLRAWWVYAVPICLLEDVGAREAMQRSRRRVRGSVRRVVLLFLAWIAALQAVGVAGLFLLMSLGGLALAVAPDSVGAVVLVVGLFVLLNLVLVTGLATLAWGGMTVLTVELYRDERGLPTGETEGSMGQRRLGYLFAAGVLIVLTVAVGMVMGDLVAVDRQVGVTAHRGSSRDAPENTLSAIRNAIGHGADFAEIDVQEIADGRIVLFHDTDFMRVAGSGRKIWEVDFEEIRGFDVGRWFSPEFEGERVPTLEEAIEEARGRIKLNIEVKHHGRERSLVPSVVGIVREADFTAECALTSLNLEAVLEVEELDPELRTGFITAEYVGDPTALGVDILSVRAARATKSLVGKARRRGKEVHAWTVNDAKTMKRLIEIGVDNIITDDPALARKVIDERERLSQQEKILLAVREWWWRK